MIDEITNELQAQMGSRTFVSSHLPFFIKLTLENGGDVFMIGDQYVDVTEIDLLIKAISINWHSSGRIDQISPEGVMLPFSSDDSSHLS